MLLQPFMLCSENRKKVQLNVFACILAISNHLPFWLTFLNFHIIFTI